MKKIISIFFVVLFALSCFGLTASATTSYNTRGTSYTQYTTASLKNKKKNGSVTFVLTQPGKSQAKVKLTDTNNRWLWESTLSNKNKNWQTFCTLNLGKNHSAYRIWFRNIKSSGTIGVMYSWGNNVTVW